MRPDDWYLTEDVDGFFARAGDFLRSRPVLHNMPLTDIEKLRARGTSGHGAEATVFGRLESGGEVRAIFYRTPRGRLTLSALSAEQAGSLAAHLACLGHPPSGVVADHDTATMFAETWQPHTGAAPVPFWRARLYRLGTLAPPQPRPEGRSRVAGEQDHEQVVRWCREFCASVGENVSIDAIDAGSWADTRFADKHFTFWETRMAFPCPWRARRHDHHAWITSRSTSAPKPAMMSPRCLDLLHAGRYRGTTGRSPTGRSPSGDPCVRPRPPGRGR
ncbi:hypothetical protein [Actinomadura sp. DC4]|uniref:hypothetical protein n=1 Tax=Actinomadura sp. DC4 TaxID=3055069 RepID=UPI0025AF0EB2|nr:hypothetical protein [Actinomadura sp. DC4]MDN3351527.1 hypothetical protein [Actinomadura sp. DC4]